jgi:hypothetical protein
MVDIEGNYLFSFVTKPLFNIFELAQEHLLFFVEINLGTIKCQDMPMYPERLVTHSRPGFGD